MPDSSQGTTADDGSGLTTRELEILQLASQGQTDKEIAASLRLSLDTVVSHWKRARRKMQAANRTEVVASAIRRLAAIELQGVTDENERLVYEIAERARTEAALRISEGQNRLITDQIPAIVWLMDPELNILSVHGRGVANLALSRDDLLGHNLADVVSDNPGELEEAMQAHKLAIKGNPTSYQHNFRGRHYEVRVVPILAENGRIEGCIGLAHDVSELRQVSLELERERDYVRAILETAPALIVVFDISCNILEFNRACQALSGFKSEDVVGQSINYLVPAEEVEGVRSVVSRLRAGESPIQHTNHWTCRDGHRSLIDWTNSIVTYADGSPAGLVATGVEVKPDPMPQR